jgi:AraC family transcriptional regulator
VPTLTRVAFERDGVRAVRATLGEHEATLLRFPAGFRLPAFDIDRPYFAVVLDGSLVKTFARSSCTLGRDCVVTLPRNATHDTDFGPRAATIVAIREADGRDGALAGIVCRHRHVRATAVSAVARRLAVELRALDASWSLAAEGLVLQLLATLSRAEPDERAPRGRSLDEACARLHASIPGRTPSLGELAAAVDVHPSHLARAFQRRHGTTVGAYARALRLEWATSQLARGDVSLAEISAAAGFADQSHFTRAFRRHTGVTPGRYRARLGR